LRAIKDGSKVRLHENTVYLGEREVATGVQQTPESVADAMVEAKAGMSAQLEAFSANTIEFLRRERTLILDGVGVPEWRVSLRDRDVRAVADGTDKAQGLRALRESIAEHRPGRVGAGSGADPPR